MATKGLDISNFQAGLSMKAVKDAGYDFVIIRAGYTGYGDGVSKAKDSRFEEFYAGAKNAGLGVGAYWFSRATSRQKGIDEANYMYNNCLKGKQFDYPIYLDVEDNYYQAKVSNRALTEAIKGFCERMEELGYFVGVYASYYWFKNYIYTNEIQKYTLWLALWSGQKPSVSFPYSMWQNSSSGNVAGYRVDTDYCYEDFPTTIRNGGFNGYPKGDKPTPQPTPTPTKKTIEELAQEVIEGKWGNGAERVKRLKEAGYDYDAVQNRVNEIMAEKKKTYYTVQKGDYLIKIGNKFGVNWKSIANLNGIKPPYIIYVGQRLRIK